MFRWCIAKQPVAGAIRRFDAVVIAHEMRFLFADPPFTVNAFRAVRLGNAMTDIAPDEETWRTVRKLRNGFNLFRMKQAGGTRQVRGPNGAVGGL